MKALKLIFLADRYHFRNFGRTITNDQYVALQYGPIPSATRNILEGFRRVPSLALELCAETLDVTRYEYRSKRKFDVQCFSQTDIDALDVVFEKYGDKDEFQLSEITHQFPEWKRHEAYLLENPSGSQQMALVDFFETASAEYDTIEFDAELLQLTKEIFQEDTAEAF